MRNLSDTRPVNPTDAANRGATAQSAFTHTLVADGLPLPCRVRRATRFIDRARGLLAHPRLLPGQALWIARCPSIHTVGMRYPIDVVFLDADHCVLRVDIGVSPLRFRWCKGAVCVLELLSDQAAVLNIRQGQQLTTSKTPFQP